MLAGLLFGALHAGAPLMQSVTGTPVDMVQVLEAVVVLFVAAPPLIRTIFRLRGAGGGLAGAVEGVERVTTSPNANCPVLLTGEPPISSFRRWLAPATFLLFGLIDICVLGASRTRATRRSRSPSRSPR